MKMKMKMKSMKHKSKTVVYNGGLYLEVESAAVSHPLPPTPYVIFNDSAFEKLDKGLQLPLRLAHKAVTDILGNKRGYKGIGVDVLELAKIAMDDSRTATKARAKKIIEARKEEIKKSVIEGLQKMGGGDPSEVKLNLKEKLDWFQSALSDMAFEVVEGMPRHIDMDDRSDLIGHAMEAYLDILSGNGTSKSSQKTTSKPIHPGPAVKTLSLKKIIRVPWNTQRKFQGFFMQEFAGTQKKAKKPKLDVPSLADLPPEVPAGFHPKKELPPHPPTIIYSRKKKTYKPLPHPEAEADDPYLGLGATVFKSIERQQKRNTAKSLKKYLEKHDIKHEETIIPDVYDVVIVQYLVGPWKDKKSSGRPFKVTAYSHGGLVYSDYFSSQKEAEKKVLYWMKKVKSKKLIASKILHFNYNNVPFTFDQTRIKKVLSVLSKKTKSGKPKGFRIHDEVDNVYRIYRGNVHPPVQSQRLISEELSDLNKSRENLEKKIDKYTAAMQKAKGGERLKMRPDLIKMTKALQEIINKQQEAEKASEDSKLRATQKRPMWIKPLKAWIRLIIEAA